MNNKPKTERKKAEEVLRDSEEKYRTLLEEVPIGICNIDVTGKCTFVNKRFEEVSGYNRDEVLGKDGFKLGMFSNETLKMFAKRIKDRLLGKAAHRVEIQFKCKDGRWIWVEMEAKLIKKFGIPIGFQLASRDITDRKRSEEELMKSEEKYRTLTENINVGIYRNTPGLKGNFIEANPAFVKMFGYDSKEEILAITASDLYQNPENREIFNDKMLKHGFVKDEELHLKKKDGTLIITSSSVVSIKDKNGEVKYYDGIVEDITGRKKAEESLRASETEKKVILDNMVDIVLLLDINLSIQWSNKATVQAMGKTEQELVGYHCYELWYDRNEPCEGCPVLGAIKTGSYARSIMMTPDGKSWEITGEPVRDRDGGIVGAIEIARDITERKRAEDEIKRRFEMEKALAGVSEIMVKAEKIDIAVKKALAILGNVFYADRCCLFQRKDREKIWANTHEWQRRGLKPLKKKLQRILSDEYQWWVGRIGRQKVIVVSDVEKLPSRAVKEMRKFKWQRIKSMLVVPLYIEDKLFGAIGVFNTRGSHHWRKNDIEILNAAGEIIVTSVAKDRFQKELTQALKEVETGRQRLEELTKRTIEAQEKERSYLASEIHDELLQNLVATLYFLQMIDVSSLDKSVKERKEKLMRIIRTSIDKGRTLIGEIEPIREPELGLIQAIQKVAKMRLEDSGISVDIKYPEKLPKMSFTIKTNILRIVQETLMNVHKHSRATKLSIKFSTLKERVKIEIKDNGVGFDKEILSKTSVGHYGLLAMKERARFVGGELTITSELGKGTTVKGLFPYK